MEHNVFYPYKLPLTIYVMNNFVIEFESPFDAAIDSEIADSVLSEYRRDANLGRSVDYRKTLDGEEFRIHIHRCLDILKYVDRLHERKLTESDYKIFNT